MQKNERFTAKPVLMDEKAEVPTERRKSHTVYTRLLQH